MPESTCSQRKGEGWKDSHLPVTLWNNTRSAQYIKEDTCGDKQPPLSLFFLNPQIGTGPLEEKSSCNHNRSHYQQQLSAAKSWSIVVVRRVATKDANV